MCTTIDPTDPKSAQLKAVAVFGESLVAERDRARRELDSRQQELEVFITSLDALTAKLRDQIIERQEAQCTSLT